MNKKEGTKQRRATKPKPKPKSVKPVVEQRTMAVSHGWPAHRAGADRTVPYTIHPDQPNEGPSGTDVPAPGFGRSRSSCVSSVNIVTAIVVIIFRRTRPPALNEITPSVGVPITHDIQHPSVLSGKNMKRSFNKS
ncbi:hypothetical protein V1478_009758 [Vespula squamosa]|uniref:Uncharacterized protein n=1 Tax=Vespula squamosa TaxID=30214 RepID=A0ABD2AK68_VESSQ